MVRFDFDNSIRANSADAASRKFANHLRKIGLDWVADEVIASVEGGYFCCSNATLHNISGNRPTHPETSDWTYYWWLENIDGKDWYGWFIERR